MRFDPIMATALFMVTEATYQLATNLINMWKSHGWVHTSLTSLVHHERPVVFLWHNRVERGLKYVDTYARDFKGLMRHTNVGLNFAHAAEWHAEPFGITLRDLEHVEEFRPDAQGYSYLSRMFAEVFILASTLGINHGIESRLIGDYIAPGFAFALNDHGVAAAPFVSAWNAEGWSCVVSDVADAYRTNSLRLTNIARIAERYLITLEQLGKTEKGGSGP